MDNLKNLKDSDFLLGFFKDKQIGDTPGSQIRSITVRKQLSHKKFKRHQAGLLEYAVVKKNGAEKTIYGAFSSKKSFVGIKNKRLFLTKLKEYGFNQGDLRIPQILGFYPKLNLILREGVTGKTMLQMMLAQQDISKVVEGAGKWVGRLHSLKYEKGLFTPITKINKKNFPYYLKTIKKYFPEKTKVLKELLSLINKISKTAPETTLIHGDYQPQNIIYNQENLTTTGFDFDASGIGDPLSDLGNFLIQFDYRAQTMMPENKIIELKKIFLEAYFQQRGREFENLNQRVNVYQAKYAIQRASFLTGGILIHPEAKIKETILGLLQKAETAVYETETIDLKLYPYPYNAPIL